ncbi:MAG: hypothetical protein WBQ62_05930 [Dehalococcoidales bacterium]|jgi:hypothetical protein
MKKLLSIIFSIAIMSFIITACNSGDSSTNTTSANIITTLTALTSPVARTEAADDLVPNTAGYLQYRSENEPQLGIVETVAITLGGDPSAFHVNYRDDIETQAGQIRNNIFYIWQQNNQGTRQNINNIVLSSDDIPAGITVNTNSGYYDKFGAEWIQIMQIVTYPNTQPFTYNFNIGVQIDGKDCGAIPCTVKVIS